MSPSRRRGRRRSRPRIAVSSPSRVAPSSRSISCAGRRVGGREVLAAAEHEPHRAPELQRRGGGQRLGDHQLAAERAAERRRLHAHAVERQPEQRRPGPGAAMNAPCVLRADDERAVGLDPRQRRLRLEVAPGGPSSCGSGPETTASARASAASTSPRCSRWRTATFGEQLRLAGVARRRRRPPCAPPPSPPSRGRASSRATRRVGGHRRLEVEHRRQRLGVDDDQRRRRPRPPPRSRRPPARPAGRTRRSPRAPAARPARPDAARRAADRRRSARRRRPARRAPRSRRCAAIRACASAASTEPRVQQPVDRHVGRVARRAAHLGLAVARGAVELRSQRSWWP